MMLSINWQRNTLIQDIQHGLKSLPLELLTNRVRNEARTYSLVSHYEIVLPHVIDQTPKAALDLLYEDEDHISFK